MIFSIPNIWRDYRELLMPHLVPYLLPLVHIALMSSVYCTVVLSWERYWRICLVSNLVSCNYFSRGKFRAYLALIIVFPALFYTPKFWEVSSKSLEGKMCRSVQVFVIVL